MLGSALVSGVWISVTEYLVYQFELPLWTVGRLSVPLLISGLLPGIFYTVFDEKRTSALLFVTLCCISCGISIAMIPDVTFFHYKSALIDEAVKDVRIRDELKRGMTVKEAPPKTKSITQRIMHGVTTALPVLFTPSLIVFYCLGIFALYGLGKLSEWKIFVVLIALGIKVVGNKGELILIAKGGLPGWITDMMLFGYEISTALMCRILQLSIPDQAAAQLFSLSSAIIEMGTRVFFYNLFLKAGMSR